MNIVDVALQMVWRCSVLLSILILISFFISGEPMMLQLCQSAKSHVIEFLTSTMEAKPSIVSNSDVKIANDECQLSQPLCCLTCLQIDHMRNRTGYLKILSKWANQLKLKILVIQKLFTKRQQYLLFIWGSNENTKSFLKNLKTHSVDVDSNGKPCKERLVNLVCTVNSENDFYKISISEGALKFEEIDSTDTLKILLNHYDLSHIYNKYVDC